MKSNLLAAKLSIIRGNHLVIVASSHNSNNHNELFTAEKDMTDDAVFMKQASRLSTNMVKPIEMAITSRMAIPQGRLLKANNVWRYIGR